MTRFAATAGTSEDGFTLLEMLVVLLILATATTVALPLLPGVPDSLRLQTTASELAAALRTTRSTAIAQNIEATLLLDVERRTFQSSAGPPRAFAGDIEAKLTFAAGINHGGTDGGFRFFPDGSSTGGDVTLLLHGRQTSVCVDWMTGMVRQKPAC